MTSWQTLRTVRPPTMLDLMSAVSVWTAWWLCDQFRPTLDGIVLVPITVAMLVKTLFGMVAIQRRTAKMIESNKDEAFIRILKISGITALFFFGCVPVVMQDARLSQIGFTLILAGLGVGHYAFAQFSPGDIKATNKDSDKTLDEMVGLYSIYGLALIGLALVSIALIKVGNDAAWVFAISIGGLVFFFLARWVSVLWLLTRRNIPE